MEPYTSLQQCIKRYFCLWNVKLYNFNKSKVIQSKWLNGVNTFKLKEMTVSLSQLYTCMIMHAWCMCVYVWCVSDDDQRYVLYICWTRRICMCVLDCEDMYVCVFLMCDVCVWTVNLCMCMCWILTKKMHKRRPHIYTRKWEREREREREEGR